MAKVKITPPAYTEKKKVRVTPPDTPHAAYGGHVPGNRFAFDAHSWNPNTYLGGNGVNPRPDPYQRVGHTLPEVPEDMANVNAERNEQVFGNFTSDGMPSLMNVDGPPHTQGGKNVNIPDGSFIYSATKSLKIKDPEILKQFDMSKPAVPADIAKKYSLQKFTKVLLNPDSDQTEKKTAQLMVENYSAKLAQLAQIQEEMKNRMGIGDNKQTMTPQGEQSPMIQQRYGGYMKAGGPMDGSLDPLTVLAARNSGYNPGQPMGLKQMNTDIDPYTAPVFNNIPDVPQPTNMQPVPGGGNNMASNVPTPPKYTKVPFTAPTPDKWGIANSLMNLSSIHKYPAWESPIGATIPDTVFLDPTRALAANSEAANAASYNTSISGNSRANRASQVAMQGEAGARAADILGKYQGENVGIANRANEQAAEITNRLSQEQANRLNRIYQGNVIASQQYDNALREGRNDLTKQWQQSWNDRQKYDLLNKTSPYFTIDPITGHRGFKSPEAEARFNSDILQFGQGQGFSLDDNKKIADLTAEYVKNTPGLDITAAWKHAAQEYTDRVRTTYDLTNPTHQKVSESESTEKKYGGRVPKRKFGGFTEHQLRKFINK